MKGSWSWLGMKLTITRMDRVVRPISSLLPSNRVFPYSVLFLPSFLLVGKVSRFIWIWLMINANKDLRWHRLNSILNIFAIYSIVVLNGSLQANRVPTRQIVCKVWSGWCHQCSFNQCSGVNYHWVMWWVQTLQHGVIIWNFRLLVYSSSFFGVCIFVPVRRTSKSIASGARSVVPVFGTDLEPKLGKVSPRAACLPKKLTNWSGCSALRAIRWWVIMYVLMLNNTSVFG